eukprot:28179-Chlamydomonas_euryale.AAC.1
MALPWGQGIRSAPVAQPGYNCNSRGALSTQTQTEARYTHFSAASKLLCLAKLSFTIVLGCIEEAPRAHILGYEAGCSMSFETYMYDNAGGPGAQPPAVSLHVHLFFDRFSSEELRGYDV